MTTSPTVVRLADLRASLHQWLDAHEEGFAAARRHAEPPSLEAAVVPELGLQRALWDAGFTRWGWPAECGGNGGSAVLRAAVYEQLVLDGYRIPQPMLTIETLGPAIVAFSPELTASHLEACLRGDEVWCQGFSEPEAGSDDGKPAPAPADSQGNRTMVTPTTGSPRTSGTGAGGDVTQMRPGGATARTAAGNAAPASSTNQARSCTPSPWVRTCAAMGESAASAADTTSRISPCSST